MDDSSPSFKSDSRIASLLEQRQRLTEQLLETPYDLVIYLSRSVIYADLGYPDLAVGDAYRALMLTNEIRVDSCEYHEQAIEALRKYHDAEFPMVLDHGLLGQMIDGDASRNAENIALVGSVRAYQVLSLGLLLIGCLKSAHAFTQRGLSVAPDNQELLNVRGYINTVAQRRLRQETVDPADFPEWGMVRREIYPWNHHEPDRYSQESPNFLNQELSTMAPKRQVQVCGQSQAVNCPECYDTVFCGQFCFDKARELYHPSACEKDVDSIAKDTDAKDADQALHLLLLARILAMAAHQGVHPLDVRQIKYTWGDFVPTQANEIDLSPHAGPPPDWTLPFSFKYNIETPIHILENMDINIYVDFIQYDLWVLNTLYSKFRGTAF